MATDTKGVLIWGSRVLTDVVSLYHIWYMVENNMSARLCDDFLQVPIVVHGEDVTCVECHEIYVFDIVSNQGRLYFDV